MLIHGCTTHAHTDTTHMDLGVDICGVSVLNDGDCTELSTIMGVVIQKVEVCPREQLWEHKPHSQALPLACYYMTSIP